MSIIINGILKKCLPAKQIGESTITTAVFTAGTVQYPKEVAVDLWNDKAAVLSTMQFGVSYDVHIDIESREVGDRYFTNVSAWKITPAAAAVAPAVAAPAYAAPAQGVAPAAPAYAAPVQAAPVQAMPAAAPVPTPAQFGTPAPAPLGAAPAQPAPPAQGGLPF